MEYCRQYTASDVIRMSALTACCLVDPTGVVTGVVAAYAYPKYSEPVAVRRPALRTLSHLIDGPA